MRVCGAIAVQSPDSEGEVFELEGCDFSALEGSPIFSEVGQTSLSPPVGRLTRVRLLREPTDCESEPEARHFAEFGPSLYVEADVEVPLAFAVEGVCLERRGKVLQKTVLRRVAITMRPAHAAYKMRSL